MARVVKIDFTNEIKVGDKTALRFYTLTTKGIGATTPTIVEYAQILEGSNTITYKMETGDIDYRPVSDINTFLFNVYNKISNELLIQIIWRLSWF